MRRSFIFKACLILLALLAGGALGLYKNWEHSFSQISVNIPPGAKVSVYKDRGGDGAYNYDTASSPLFVLSSSQKIKLKKGVYDFALSNPDQYSNPVTKASISYGTNEVDIKPSLSEEKLGSLLQSVRPIALNALYAKYPDINANYAVSKDSLYMLGDWYGALLKPKDPSFDTLRVIMRKKGDSWMLAVQQPDLSFGEPSNPGVPAEVLDGVDNF